MQFTSTQRAILERFINAVETGRPEGNYAAISIYADGPHNIRQITYGRAQTTEYGNLRKLVQMYVDANGQFSLELRRYADKIGSEVLTSDKTFIKLLKDAGKNDPVMRGIQDSFFEQVYFKPAMKWADDNGFKLPLSALVIYDSFIHSGQILWLLRQKFPASPPASGGQEKEWTSQYINARHDWLANHSRAILQKTIYRTKALKEQVQKGNWQLDMLPIVVNGISVTPG